MGDLEKSYNVVLFLSVSHAIRAEKLLKACGIDCKLIPVPRHLSSDCGLCLRFPTGRANEVEKALRGILKDYTICEL